MNNKEEIKEFLKKSFGIQGEALEEFTENLLKEAELHDSLPAQESARIWKKEEIEALGIEVKPVKWKKFD